MTTTVTVTTTQLEEFAFESGRQITLRPTRGELRIGSHLFVAPLSIPAQRKGGDS